MGASRHPSLRVVDSDDAPAIAPPEMETTESLFREYAPYVAKVALRLLGRDHEVDDVVQDVFLDAHKGIARVRDRASMKGWLRIVTVRAVYRRLRRRRWRNVLGLERDVAEQEHIAPEPLAPESRAALRRIYELLDTLPTKERVAWALRYIEGEPLDAVALACDCSLATINRRIAAAHEKIRRGVHDE